jgi:peptide chain release factor 1
MLLSSGATQSLHARIVGAAGRHVAKWPFQHGDLRLQVLAISCSGQQRHILSSAVNLRLESMVNRHEQIMKELQEVSSSSSGDSFSILGKELSSLNRIVALQQKRTSLDEEEQSLKELLEESSTAKDKEMENDCRNELEALLENSIRLEQRIVHALLPVDEDEHSGTILEVRAGTGGDEASIFAAELLESYVKTASSMKWTVETLSETKTDLGGIRETVLSVTSSRGGGFSVAPSMDDEDDGDFLSSIGPYGLFKYESGVHRVQRVPVNDTRIHTSACSVAALPMVDDSGQSDELLPLSELRIETMRSSGAGGQHVNTTESAVRITHIPTGITASIQDERSQHKNKDKALKLIAARVRDLRRSEDERERGEAKSSLMGRGDRSERIRTYNYPQDRVTDHRCKHSTHGIAKLLSAGADGGLVVEFYPFLRDMNREELMRQFLKDDS